MLDLQVKCSHVKTHALLVAGLQGPKRRRLQSAVWKALWSPDPRLLATEE